MHVLWSEVLVGIHLIMGHPDTTNNRGTKWKEKQVTCYPATKDTIILEICFIEDKEDNYVMVLHHVPVNSHFILNFISVQIHSWCFNFFHWKFIPKQRDTVNHMKDLMQPHICADFTFEKIFDYQLGNSLKSWKIIKTPLLKCIKWAITIDFKLHTCLFFQDKYFVQLIFDMFNDY